MKKMFFLLLVVGIFSLVSAKSQNKKSALVLIKGPHPIVDVDTLNKDFFRFAGNSKSGYHYIQLVNLNSPTEQQIARLINKSKELNPEIKNWDKIQAGHLVLWRTKGLYKDDFYTIFRHGQTATEIAKKILTLPVITE